MRFQLLGIPIQVNPLFFVTAVALGLMDPTGQENVPWLFAWVAIVFVGVLMHELGHAFMGRAFGLTPNIELYMLGGLTWWESGRQLSPGRSILISVAGPGVGIVIGMVAFAAAMTLAPQPGTFARYLLNAVWFVNLGWGVLNLLPLLPLDGGNVMASVFELFSKESGRRFARYISLFVAVGLAALAFAYGAIFGGALCALLGFNNWRALQAEKQLRKDLPFRDDLRSAYQGLADGDALAVATAGRRIAEGSATRGMQLEGRLLGIWARLLRGETERARADFDALPQQLEDPSLQGALALAEDDTDGALRAFEVAFEREDAGPGEMVRLVAAFRATGRWDVAIAFLDSKVARKVPPEAIAHLAEAAREAGSEEDAKKLESLAEA